MIDIFYYFQIHFLLSSNTILQIRNTNQSPRYHN